MLILRCVVGELKTVSKLEPVHLAQLTTYIRVSVCEVDRLINVTRSWVGCGAQPRMASAASRCSTSANSGIDVPTCSCAGTGPAVIHGCEQKDGRT